MVAGQPGSGKSTISAKASDSIPGPAVLVSAEEGISPSLAARLIRANIKRDDFHIISRASVDQVVSFACQNKAKSLVVDSVHECAWTASELRHAMSMIPSLDVLFAVLQVNKLGEPAGSMTLQHEADVLIGVEAMRWRLLKSRYQSIDGVGGEVLPPSESTSNEEP
jgi:predicted ATP-dependent serine protease